MSFNVTRAETQSSNFIEIGDDDREIEQSSRMSAGTFDSPWGTLEWEKHFISNHTLKSREDFVIIRTDQVPGLEETFSRLDRVASLGERAVRRCEAVLGAKLKPEAVVCETNGGCVQTSTDLRFTAELPLAVSDLATIEELDVKEDGEGLFWIRLYGQHFDLYADNPAAGQSHQALGVTLGVPSPGRATDPGHLRWQRADAWLTPTTTDLPGVLGDMSLRTGLLNLKPGATSV